MGLVGRGGGGGGERGGERRRRRRRREVGVEEDEVDLSLSFRQLQVNTLE